VVRELWNIGLTRAPAPPGRERSHCDHRDDQEDHSNGCQQGVETEANVWSDCHCKPSWHEDADDRSQDGGEQSSEEAEDSDVGERMDDGLLSSRADRS
jgi:hypothetical protein